MTFRKLDQMQLTLSGEIKWHHPDTPTSMNAPSIMALSTLPNSPTFIQ